MPRKYHQGKFKPKNPEKYIGDPTNIIYRSSWELRLANYFDSDPKIIKWSSEEIIIPYYWEVDNKMHRYFVDFQIYCKTKTGIKRFLVEVKPYAQTIAPVNKRGKRKARLQEELLTHSKNTSKWIAAKKWCKERGYEFLIITERDLFPNGKAW